MAGGFKGNLANGRKLVADAAAERVARVTVYFWNAVQMNLNRVSNPRPYKVPTPAPKGGPPAKRTGFGAANVLYTFDPKIPKGRVGLGANAKYMLFLERRDHPWLIYTLNQVRPQLAAIATGGK